MLLLLLLLETLPKAVDADALLRPSGLEFHLVVTAVVAVHKPTGTTMMPAQHHAKLSVAPVTVGHYIILLPGDIILIFIICGCASAWG